MAGIFVIHQSGTACGPVVPCRMLAVSVESAASGTKTLPVLISRIAEGDEEAMARLYDATSGLIYGMARNGVHDAGIAEEIALEVYMQVWRTAGSYDPGRGSVTAWLATATRSRCMDWIRTRQARFFREGLPLNVAFQMAGDSASADAANDLQMRCDSVRLALQSLPAEQRQVIDLAFFSGLSHSEIADKLDLPLGTVKSRIRVGMSRLREPLRPWRGAGL
ncbi:MAG: putative polymerase sigma factor, sigma-24 [Bryobacterales bacterium]|jgi:RNA polymerase sigma-70 factor (ECF subfamily)|nr:putative polymerase sigma factor, sigma-24 [Bryobacterales bacterium]